MADKITPDRRSKNMSAIRSKGMKPELAVRSLVHRLGFRFRLHRKDLPGKPDLVFPGRRKVIFFHGCFWHQHPDPACADSRLPQSNAAYWKPKLARNVERDRRNVECLEAAGWSVLTVWECDLRKPDILTARIKTFLEGQLPRHQADTKNEGPGR